MKTIKVTLTDEEAHEHEALAQRADMKPGELGAVYIRRANAVANGRSIVEDNALPSRAARSAAAIAKTFTPNAPGVSAGSLVPFAGDLPARGPMPKGRK